MFAAACTKDWSALAIAVALGALPHGAARAALYAFDFHVHSEDTAADYAPNAVLIPIVQDGIVTRPVGSTWDFTGAAAEGSLWVLPQNQDPDVVFLGLSTESLNPLAVASDVMLNLVGVTGTGGSPAPGVFSMWSSTTMFDAASLTALMSTAPGSVLSNTVTVPLGQHAHYNYGFSAPGLYQVEFQASATLVGGGVATGSAVFSFGAFAVGEPYPDPLEPQPPYTFFGQSFPGFVYGYDHADIGLDLIPVPEPSSVALAAAGGGILVALAVRRRRRHAAADPKQNAG